jgi:hypothetical protein
MSQGMNEFLASYYNTAPQPTAEELQHAQQIDFFAKTAAANGIDLEALSQDQVNWLWSQVFTDKTAESKTAEPKVVEKEPVNTDGEKKAEAEFTQKKEAMAKIAEADFLGRVMAHSFYNESVKIASAKEAEVAKVAEFPPKKDEKDEKKEEKKEEGGSLKERLMAAASKKEEKDEKEEKKASVSELDMKSAELAVQKLAASNHWDVNEGVERLNAVLTLGVKDSVKVASAPNFEAALDVRSLELLELAGYPIKWEG